MTASLKRYLLPLTLGVLGLLLLGRIFISGTSIYVPEDIDVVVLLSLLGVAMAVAIHTIVRISMAYLRFLSVQRARRETLAEHGRFLRRLDHELKNPLTALRAGLSALALTGLDQQQQNLIKTMETETLRLSRLVADLRKLGELETQPLDLQPLNVEAFVAGIVQVEQERFAAGQRSLTSHIDAAPAAWIADEDLLALAVHNVLDNAFKYTQPGDSIFLEISTENGLTIRVRDTGPGIPPGALRHIWEELYRAEQADKVPGSGIGLALVKVIAERHNGAVDIDSEPGQGTVVSIHLPAMSQS
jgi:two-component system, OmpR family, sensor kinase